MARGTPGSRLNKAVETGEHTAVQITADDAAALIQSTKSLVPDTPTQFKRIISLCPISKVLQQYVDLEPYLENPEKVFEEEKFTILVENSWATKIYNYGEAYLVKDSEADVLVGLANNRFERSTGHTGFVYFEAPPDMIAAYDYSKKTGKKVDPDLQKDLNGYLEKAKMMSHARVIEYLKVHYNTMALSRQTMKENNSNAGAATDLEMLISFILQDDIKRKTGRRQRLRKLHEEAKAFLEGKDEIA